MARRNERRDDRDNNKTSSIPATRAMPFEGQVATAAEDISADRDGSFVRFRMVRKARSRNGYEDELWNTVVVSYPYAQGVLNSLTDENNNFKKFRVVGEGALELNVYENKERELQSEYQIRADWIGASFIFGATYEPPEKDYPGNDDEDEDDRRNSRRGTKRSRRDEDDEDDDDDEDDEEDAPRRRSSTKSRRSTTRRSSKSDDDEDEDNSGDDEDDEEKPAKRRSARRSSRSRTSRVESHGDDEDDELD